MEDTFKDIAVYSTLALILFRKQEGVSTQELPENVHTKEWIDNEIALQDRDNRGDCVVL